MIRQGIINFLKNLKYFFVPLGATALGLVFGLSIFVSGFTASVKTLASEIKTTISETNIDVTVLKEEITVSVKSLNWKNPYSAVRTMLSTEWLIGTINGCVDSLVDSAGVYTSQINTSIKTFKKSLKDLLVTMVILTSLASVCGFLLTRDLIRRNVAKRAWWQYFLVSLTDSVIGIALVALSLWLMTLWKPSIYFSTALSLMLFGVIGLSEAYLLHARKKVRLKKIVNFKNIFKLFATELILFAFSAVAVNIVSLITNLAVGLFVGMALIEISFIVIGYNSDSFVKRMVDESATRTSAPGSPAETLAEPDNT